MICAPSRTIFPSAYLVLHCAACHINRPLGLPLSHQRSPSTVWIRGTDDSKSLSEAYSKGLESHKNQRYPTAYPLPLPKGTEPRQSGSHPLFSLDADILYLFHSSFLKFLSKKCLHTLPVQQAHAGFDLPLPVPIIHSWF